MSHSVTTIKKIYIYVTLFKRSISYGSFKLLFVTSRAEMTFMSA